MFVLSETKKHVVIATKNSRNRKTGSGVQVWILDATMHPSDSRRGGFDAKNQCKGCPFASYGGCYVSDLPLASIWNTWRKGGYQRLNFGTKKWKEFFDSAEFVRFGAYGNPSLVPLRMVRDIAKRVKTISGYFHDWHLMKPERAQAYGEFFMASCEANTYKKAQSLGLRTFTTLPTKEKSNKKFGIECLADKTGTIQCKDCGLCDGNRRKNKVRPNVWIRVHGYQLNKAVRAVN